MNPQKNEENRTEKNRMITGTIVTIAGGILWGVSGVCGQYMFQNKGVTAPWLVSVRLVAAGLLMLCYYFLTDREQTLAIWKSKRDRRDMLIYGLLGMMPCQYAYFQTIEWSNAGTATVIQYLGPALIVIWVCFRTKRMPTVQEVIGVILAVIGVFLIATHGNPTTLALSGRALLMGLASAVAVALYTLEPARLQKKYDTPLILAWGMAIGGIALTLISRPWTVKGIQVDTEMFTALAFVVVFGTMAGFSLYMTGVKLIGSVKASLYACVEPVSSMILTVLWMKVKFTTPDLIGTLFVIATIIILAIPTKKQ
nr:EamA family transporter [uncultured Blautia sp.]